MDGTTVLLTVISPLVMALIRRRSWSKELAAFMAVVTITALYIIGQALDQALTWPLPSGFWIGLLAAYGSQQLIYSVLQAIPPGTSAIERLEEVGNTKPKAKVYE